MGSKLFANLGACIFTLGVGISGNVLGMKTDYIPQSQLRIVGLLNNPCSISTTSDSNRTVERIIYTGQQATGRLSKKIHMLEERKMRKFGFSSASQSETPDQTKVREKYEEIRFQNKKNKETKEAPKKRKELERIIQKTKNEEKRKELERIYLTTKSTLSISGLPEEVKTKITNINKETLSFEKSNREEKRMGSRFSKYTTHFKDTGKRLVSSGEYRQFLHDNLGPLILGEYLGRPIYVDHLLVFLKALGGVDLNRAVERSKFAVEKITSLILPYVVERDGTPLMQRSNMGSEI